MQYSSRSQMYAMCWALAETCHGQDGSCYAKERNGHNPFYNCSVQQNISGLIKAVGQEIILDVFLVKFCYPSITFNLALKILSRCTQSQSPSTTGQPGEGA